ncbi:tetratricopeptide repeat-containing sulfotransferase family protein [Tsuneonella amylolytica]|uniref:tetratricopeptide repeat-containing sulfotransferase family protein n=1 Tax=Tsuneonella amylolytica TaxID=2338327 RepID=UPI000EA8EDEC|nr:sulfotransferase [Tsuneonella amylolytica]
MVTQRDTLLLRQFQSALAAGGREAVNRAAAPLVAARSPLGRSWNAVASVLLHNGEYTLARQAADLLAEQAPGDPTSPFRRVAVYARTGRLEEARAMLDALPPTLPSPVAYAYTRGTTATNLGRLDEAREWLRRAVAADPASGQSWLALSMLGKLEAEDSTQLRKAAAAIRTAPPLEQAAWLYATGRTHDTEGETAKATAAFSEGAALMAAERPYNHAAAAADAAAARAGWTAEAIAALASNTTAAARRAPIFVTGLPRSGTTLVEQILGSHSAVAGGGELGLMRILVQEVGGRDADRYRRWLADDCHCADDLVTLFDHLADQAVPGPGRLIDKSLGTSRDLGLISAILPAAPIVWLRRDPLDCAFSAYTTWFQSGQEWSWSLPAIARHFMLEDALHAHWARHLEGRVLTVHYSALVDRPEDTIAAILAHCDLAPEPACFRPHEADRAVITASAAQVRQPINKAGVGRSSRYADLLAPFGRTYRS